MILIDTVFLQYAGFKTVAPCKPGIKVVSTGELLPEDWIGKIFDSADSFHKAIDTLDSRINKPPVTYLANYCMEYVKEKKIRVLPG